jgi:hypothetical protein
LDDDGIPGKPMKEEKEDPLLEAGEKPTVEAVEEPEIEAIEEPTVEAVDDPGIEAIEEPTVEAVDDLGIEAIEEPKVEAVEEPEPEAIDPSKLEGDHKPESEGGEEEGGEDGLELDRMEVQPVSEAQEEDQAEPEEVEPQETEAEEPARSTVLALLSDHWILIVAFLVGLAVVSAAFVFIMTPREGPGEVKLGARMHVISASLGGEHYVRFNLWGPFRDPEGEAVLRRGLPKVKHDLILSGSNPEVGRSIQENDLYFLEKHILKIVSEATGIPLGELDLKGLFVTRYSDEAEVEGAR